MLNIVAFKWMPYKDQLHSIPSQALTTYNCEYVNKLYRGLKRNISPNIEWKFTLVTDNLIGDLRQLEPDINYQLYWTEYRDLGGCYSRLKTFSSEIKELFGSRFMCIDLDTIIVGNIDHIVNRTEDFVYYRAPGANGKGHRMNCGMYMMSAGSRSYIWEDFKENPERAMHLSRQAFVGTDQAWCNYRFGPALRSEAHWDLQDGIYDMRQHFLEQNTTELPADACIVVWPGPRDPAMTQYQDIDWVKENWI